ncbi:hypothetical protein ACJX0J_007810 [Zea mays]
MRHNLDYLLGTFLALPGNVMECEISKWSNMAGCTLWFGIVSIPTIPLASSCFFNEGGFTDIEKQIGTLWHERGEDLCSDLLALEIIHGHRSHTEVDINNNTVGVQNVDIIDASVVEDLHRQRDEEDYFEDEEDETGRQYASDNDESNIPNVFCFQTEIYASCVMQLKILFMHFLIH